MRLASPPASSSFAAMPTATSPGSLTNDFSPVLEVHEYPSVASSARSSFGSGYNSPAAIAAEQLAAAAIAIARGGGNAEIARAGAAQVRLEKCTRSGRVPKKKRPRDSGDEHAAAAAPLSKLKKPAAAPGHATLARSPPSTPSTFPPPTATATKPSSRSTLGQKRPRHKPPNSKAVKAAMPKPPPRGQKNEVREAVLLGLEPEEARLEKNRQSAKECRLRKKEYVVNLEMKLAEFESREEARIGELAAIRREVAELRRKLAGRC